MSEDIVHPLKRCPTCGEEKAETEFSWQVKAKGRRQSRCKLCHAAYERSYRRTRIERTAEIQKRDYDKHREHRLAQKREYYRSNKELISERNRLSYQQRRDTPEQKEYNRRYSLLSKFGLTLEDYERMVEAQGGRCCLCGKEAKRLHVDHCHDTGRIRGLLCAPCNSFLGRINDSLEVLERIKVYLTSE